MIQYGSLCKRTGANCPSPSYPTIKTPWSNAFLSHSQGHATPPAYVCIHAASMPIDNGPCFTSAAAIWVSF